MTMPSNTALESVPMALGLLRCRTARNFLSVLCRQPSPGAFYRDCGSPRVQKGVPQYGRTARYQGTHRLGRLCCVRLRRRLRRVAIDPGFKNPNVSGVSTASRGSNQSLRRDQRLAGSCFLLHAGRPRNNHRLPRSADSPGARFLPGLFGDPTRRRGQPLGRTLGALHSDNLMGLFFSSEFANTLKQPPDARPETTTKTRT